MDGGESRESGIEDSNGGFGKGKEKGGKGMIETILCGLPIVVGSLCVALGIVGYVAVTLKLIDGKYKMLGWLMAIGGTIGGILLLAYVVGILI